MMRFLFRHRTLFLFLSALCGVAFLAYGMKTICRHEVLPGQGCKAYSLTVEPALIGVGLGFVALAALILWWIIARRYYD